MHNALFVKPHICPLSTYLRQVVLGKKRCIVQVVSGVEQQLRAACRFGGRLAHTCQHNAWEPHQMLHRNPRSQEDIFERRCSRACISDLARQMSYLSFCGRRNR